MRGWLATGLSFALYFSPPLAAEEFEDPLILQDPSGASSFGWSVALSGDTLAVGDNDPASGSVWVFERRRNGSRWRLDQRLRSPEPRNSPYFGRDLCALGYRPVPAGQWVAA